MCTYWWKDIRFGKINGPAICFSITWDKHPDYGPYIGFEISCKSVTLLLWYLTLSTWWWFK